MLNYLKRRFSSTELINEIRSGVGYSGQQGQSSQIQQGQRQTQEYKYLPEEVRRQTVEQMFTQGTAEGGQGRGTRMPFPSAPSSPTKQVPAMGTGVGGVGGSFMNTMTGQLNKAKHLFSTETLNSIISDVKVPGVGSGSKSKILLVIDHPLTDWAKYFYKRKVGNDWDVRVEQAQLNDISITAYPNQGCVVTVQDGRSTHSQVRTFKPDFVLIRQGLGAATQHYENLITGLMFGAVPCMNSVEAVYNMRNKAWLQPDFQMPVNVRLGGDSARECEVRVEDTTLFQSLMSLANNTQRYATTEPCIQSVCEIFIQKIGPFSKAFKRKPISNPSLVSSGSTVLEKIPVTPKFNQWIAEVSQIFGGLDMCAIKALQDANGDYFIQDVYGSDFILLGDGQEEDRTRIAELLLQKMEYVHKMASGTERKTSQSQVSQEPPRPVQAASKNSEISAIPSTTLDRTRPQPVQQTSYSMHDLQQPQQSALPMQNQLTSQQPKPQPSLTLKDQQKPQKPPTSKSSGSAVLQGFEEPQWGSFGRQNISGSSMEFQKTRPPLQTQQKMQSSLESSSQASRNESNVRDSLDWSTTTSTINASMDFSGQPSSTRMSFGGENEDKFDKSSISGKMTSSTAGASRSVTERKVSDQWSPGAGYASGRPVRESSLEGTGGVRGRPQKEAAPQPPRQPSLANNLENRSVDTFRESSDSSISMPSTNIFDPSMNVLQSQKQSKPSSTTSSFHSQTQGKDIRGTFDSPSMDFGQSSLTKIQHNDPWSVPPAQGTMSQAAQSSSAFNSSMSSMPTASGSRPTAQQSSGNPDDGDDTMKNLRKTFAGIFGDI
ncbi:hypothetical protein Aperf_G00000046988 [Anoplocephala perfoliata]